jgi:hypothetical protein
MSCRLAHQQKDNSHDQTGEDFSAERSGDSRRVGGIVMERRPADSWYGPGDGGTSSRRKASDAYELCRSRAPHGEAV